MAEQTNEDLAKTIASTPDTESIKKAITRRVSVTDILENERDGWHERHRGVMVKHQKHLGHPLVHRTFDRYFEKMSQYMYFIPVMGRILIEGKNHKDVMLIEKAITKVMQDSIAKLDALNGQYKAVIEAHDIAVGGYNKTHAVEVSFASPLDKMYFTVLEKADQCLMLNYNLWVEQALHPDYDKNETHRTENEWEVKVIMREVIRVTVSNFRRLLNNINRQQRSGKAVDAADTKAPTDAVKNAKPKAVKKAPEAPVVAAEKITKAKPVDLAPATAAIA